MKKIVEDINVYLDKMVDDLNNKRILRGLIKFFAMIAVTICMSLCLIWLCYLIYENISYIIIVVGGIGCLIAFFRSLYTKKQSQDGASTQGALPHTTNFIQYDPITLENTYKLIRSNICTVLGEISDIIKVRKPASYSQMDSPVHYDIVANVPIYHYLIPKSGEIDVYTAMGILQNAIEQKLNNNELAGISQAVFFYNGAAYPALMVENFKDLGNFAQIDIAVASEYYCRYREQRLYNNMNQSNNFDPKDFDF